MSSGGGLRPSVVSVKSYTPGDRSPVAALARRPDLWPVAARFVPRRWWATWPPVPFPRAHYRHFRSETMYGDERGASGEDLITYLEWCRRQHSGGD